MIITPNPSMQLDEKHPASIGLKSWWLFDEGGGERVNDRCGKVGGGGGFQKGNPARIQGYTQSGTSGWKGSPKGHGFLFDGVDDTALAAAFGLPTSGTNSVCIRFKRITTVGTFDTLFSVGKAASAKAYAIDINGGSIRWGDELADEKTVMTITNDVWYDVVCTYDGSATAAGLKIWVNGNQEATTSVGTFDGFEGPWITTRIGAKAGSSEMSNAIIDDVRVYNRVLPPNEIKDYCNGVLPLIKISAFDLIAA